MLNPSGGTDSHDVKNIVISFNDGDACSPTVACKICFPVYEDYYYYYRCLEAFKMCMCT